MKMTNNKIVELKEKTKEIVEMINELKGHNISESDLRGRFFGEEANYHTEIKGNVYHIVIQKEVKGDYIKAKQ